LSDKLKREATEKSEVTKVEDSKKAAKDEESAKEDAEVQMAVDEEKKRLEKVQDEKLK